MGSLSDRLIELQTPGINKQVYFLKPVFILGSQCQKDGKIVICTCSSYKVLFIEMQEC